MIFRRLGERLTERISDLLHGRARITPEALEEIEEAMIAADFGVPLTKRLIKELRERVAAFEGDVEWLKRRLSDLVLEVLRRAEVQRLPSETPPGEPRVLFLVGVNGSGKTTTAAKLAWRNIQEGKRVLLAAADTFRAAAIDQLVIWGERVGAQVICHAPGGDPAAVVFDAASAARARKADLLIVDTAGRLHTRRNLMEELAKVRRAAGKVIPQAPHESLLVIDGSSGSNATAQAKEFLHAAGVDGIVVTKLDGTAKGGTVVAIADLLALPVRFVGVGEGIGDLLPFDAEVFARGLFGL